MGRVSFSVLAQGFIFINRTMQVSYVFHLMRYMYCARGVCMVHCVHCALCALCRLPIQLLCAWRVHCALCALCRLLLYTCCPGFFIHVMCRVSQCLNVMCMFPLLLLCRVSNYFTMLCMIPLFFVHGFLLCACPGFLFTYLLHRVSCSAVVQGFLINYVIVVLLNSCGGISH